MVQRLYRVLERELNNSMEQDLRCIAFLVRIGFMLDMIQGVEWKVRWGIAEQGKKGFNPLEALGIKLKVLDILL